MFLPHIEIYHSDFRKLVLANTHLEKLWSGGLGLRGQRGLQLVDIWFFQIFRTIE
jgi:hypothetical protein